MSEPVQGVQEQINPKKRKPKVKPKKEIPTTTTSNVGEKNNSSSSNNNNNESSSEGTEAKVKETRKAVTDEDMLRYNNYVGQQWTGVCKWFNVSKGFGFIIPDHEEAKEHEDEIFVHQTALKMEGFRSLDEGEAVQFTLRIGSRGLEAESVTGLNGAELRGHTVRPIGKRKTKKNIRRCYNCGELGFHKASNCPKPSSNVKICYYCHSTEHIMADCPKHIEKRKLRKPSESKTAETADSTKNIPKTASSTTTESIGMGKTKTTQ